MKPKLKICGLTNLADARYCAGAGADYLGFIQYEKSPRYVDPKTAGEIIQWIYGPETVGVFVNTPTDVVNQTVDEAGFTYVQLHGDETPWECSQIQVDVIKAIRIKPDTDLRALRNTLDAYAPYVDRFLLDTHHPAHYGGTGQAFDWSVAQALADDYSFFLAGGLRTENIEAAVRTVQPYGVDLSSHLEARPGQKDFDKLVAFFDTFQQLISVL